jgi:hypothetical protein
MVHRCSRANVELPKPRALLSRSGTAVIPEFRPETEARASALIGSIQGEQVFKPYVSGWQFVGSGSLKPMGSITVTGSFMANKKTGAVNGHGTLSFTNTQFSLIHPTVRSRMTSSPLASAAPTVAATQHGREQLRYR